MFRNRSKFLLTLACSLLLSACYEEEEMTVEVMQLTPAQVDLRHQRIAVLPFAGLGGDALSERLDSHLRERGFTALAAKTQDGAPTAHHAVEDIVEVAGNLGVDVLLEGGTTEIDVLEELAPSYDPATRLTTYDRRIKLVLEGQAQLRSAQGDTLHSMRFDASHAPRVMGTVRVEGRPPHDEAWVYSQLKPFDALAYLHGQLDAFVERVREETQPVYRRTAWILFQVPSVSDSLHAVTHARASRWPEAAAIYTSALPRVRGLEARALVHYNLGVTKVMQGLHAEAAKDLRAAAELTRKPRLSQLCAEALADNDAILKARQQVKLLGWSLEN